MSIEDAPRRIQREHYRRQRIANIIAILVVAGVLAAIAFTIVWLVG
jgi:hypothetical protein